MTMLMNLFCSSPLLAAAAPRRGFWMPEQASTVSGEIDSIFMLITWISVFFFVLIVVLMGYFMVKYRRVEGHKSAASPSHNTPLELTWTIIPVIIVIVIFYMGMTGYINLRSVPVDAYEIDVTAQKWGWTFQHPSGAIETETLTIPKGRPVRLMMTSQDVLHSLFIPAFRVKQDVVPGRYTYLWFEASATGRYDLFCTEYCGTGHATMGAVVEVYEEDEFEEKLEELLRWIEDIPEERLFVAGKRLYNRCVQCHSLDGAPGIGPSFRETHELWGQERRLADGRTVTVDENYVKESIIYPAQDITEGYGNLMPSFRGQLRERELRALVQFIRHLDRFDDEGNLLEEWQ